VTSKSLGQSYDRYLAFQIAQLLLATAQFHHGMHREREKF
jgi:hypothetical protein